jgi:hypothetical protein
MSAFEAPDDIVGPVPALSWFVLFDQQSEQAPLSWAVVRRWIGVSGSVAQVD